jgi:thiamine-phosphate pyrophosphorylase
MSVRATRAAHVVRWEPMARHPRCLLYYITDRTQFSGDETERRRALLAKILEAASAGVDYIQLRERDLGARDLERLAKDAVALAHSGTFLRTENLGQKPALLINSRADVALAAAADGVHLRSEDIPASAVRAIWKASGVGARAGVTAPVVVVGVSCHKAEDVSRAEQDEADFAVFAPVFGKLGLAGAPPVGLAALRETCRAKIRVLALGGVTLENAASCLDAGAAGVAGIRLFQENKIEDVVRALRGL